MRRFWDKETEPLWAGKLVKGIPADIQRRAHRKLQFLMAARLLDDLEFPTGNRLEALKGDRRGQYAMRVHAQYRICFRWTADGAMMIEHVDYH